VARFAAVTLDLSPAVKAEGDGDEVYPPEARPRGERTRL
jgi:hypothetical protein